MTKLPMQRAASVKRTEPGHLAEKWPGARPRGNRQEREMRDLAPELSPTVKDCLTSSMLPKLSEPPNDLGSVSF